MATTVEQRVRVFWRARNAALKAPVEMIHTARLEAAALDASLMCELFLNLPSEWPCPPREFGLTWSDVFAQELRLLQTHARELRHIRGAVETACSAPLELVRLCPFVIAVFVASLNAAVSQPRCPLASCSVLARGVRTNRCTLRTTLESQKSACMLGFLHGSLLAATRESLRSSTKLLRLSSMETTGHRLWCTRMLPCSTKAEESRCVLDRPHRPTSRSACTRRRAQTFGVPRRRLVKPFV